MRIDGLPPLARQALLAAIAAEGVRARPADDAAIDAAPAAAPPPPSGNPAAALPPPTTSVAMLVTLASIDPAVEKRRKEAVRTDRGLALLEGLRDELAAGIASPERVQEMAAWVAAGGMPDDPALAEIARDVELRVRVELAKHDLTA